MADMLQYTNYSYNVELVKSVFRALYSLLDKITFLGCGSETYMFDPMEDLLMCKELQEFYSTVVYEHRNKCAHNLLSLQKNLPTLKTLEEEEFVYDNYYFRFTVLVLLDEIFVRLFKAYLGAMARYKVARA